MVKKWIAPMKHIECPQCGAEAATDDIGSIECDVCGLSEETLPDEEDEDDESNPITP